MGEPAPGCSEAGDTLAKNSFITFGLLWMSARLRAFLWSVDFGVRAASR